MATDSSQANRQEGTSENIKEGDNKKARKDPVTYWRHAKNIKLGLSWRNFEPHSFYEDPPSEEDIASRDFIKLH